MTRVLLLLLVTLLALPYILLKHNTGVQQCLIFGCMGECFDKRKKKEGQRNGMKRLMVSKANVYC